MIFIFFNIFTITIVNTIQTRTSSLSGLLLLLDLAKEVRQIRQRFGGILVTWALHSLSDVERLLKGRQGGKVLPDLTQYDAYGIKGSRRFGRIVVAKVFPLEHQALVEMFEGVSMPASLGLERSEFVESIGFVELLLKE